MFRIIKFSISVVFLFLLGVLYLSLYKDNSYNTVGLVGKKIGQIELESFNEDKIFTTDDLRKNKYTLINFWSSWCAPCRTEHPILMKLKNSKKIDLIGVNFKDKKKNAKTFLKDLGNPYNFIGRDELGKQSVNFGVYGIPESILVNQESLIIYKFVGPLTNQDYNKILKIIN